MKEQLLRTRRYSEDVVTLWTVACCVPLKGVF